MGVGSPRLIIAWVAGSSGELGCSELAWGAVHEAHADLLWDPALQELRSREEELSRAALQQKSQELQLRRREQQLAKREIDVLERELNVLIFQLSQEAPHVKKRKGRFRKGRLRLKDGHRISLPSGLCRQDWGKPRRLTFENVNE